MAAGLSPPLNLGEEELSSFDRNIAFTVSVEVFHPRRTQHHFYGAFHVAKRLAFGRPMMRRGVGFDTDQGWRQLLEEVQDVRRLKGRMSKDVDN
jgi:hypothetical protein